MVRLQYVGLVLLALTGCHESREPPETGKRYEGRSLREWGQQLRKGSVALRREAARVLARLGEQEPPPREALPDLMAALKDPDVQTRGWAAVALVRAARGTPAPVTLLADAQLKEGAASEDPELRQAAQAILQHARTKAGPPGFGKKGPADRRPATPLQAEPAAETPPPERAPAAPPAATPPPAASGKDKK